MLTSNFPQLSPSRISKHSRMGSVQMSCHTLTTHTEPWSFIKPLVQNKVVHMKLGIRLSFYLRHHCGIPRQHRGGFRITKLPPNPAKVPIVTYENIFYLLSRGCLFNRPLDGRLGGYCWVLVPRVLWVTGYGPTIQTRSVPYSGKRLENYTPRTEHGPTPPS
jgi:hypothetical protein